MNFRPFVENRDISYEVPLIQGENDVENLGSITKNMPIFLLEDNRSIKDFSPENYIGLYFEPITETYFRATLHLTNHDIIPNIVRYAPDYYLYYTEAPIDDSNLKYLGDLALDKKIYLYDSLLLVQQLTPIDLNTISIRQLRYNLSPKPDVINNLVSYQYVAFGDIVIFNAPYTNIIVMGTNNINETANNLNNAIILVPDTLFGKENQHEQLIRTKLQSKIFNNFSMPRILELFIGDGFHSSYTYFIKTCLFNLYRLYIINHQTSVL
ncbi:MAG: hypothetical protein ACRC0X_02890 [Brevinema sp.]